MGVSAADIKALPSGEFAKLDVAAIQPFIDEAIRELNAGVFGARLDDATKYLAAHLLGSMRAGSTGPAGPVTSQTAGPVSQSYAAPAGLSEEALLATPYGRRFLDIRRQVAGGPQVV